MHSTELHHKCLDLVRSVLFLSVVLEVQTTGKMSVFLKHRLADDVQSLFVYRIYNNDAYTMLMFLRILSFLTNIEVLMEIPDSNRKGKIWLVPFDKTV